MESGVARSVTACLLAATLSTVGAAVCAWRRKRSTNHANVRQVGSRAAASFVDDTTGAAAPVAPPAATVHSRLPLARGSSSPSIQLPAALQAERVDASNVISTKSRSPVNSTGVAPKSRPAMIGSAARSRAGSTGVSSHQQTVMLESTMDTRAMSSTREGTALLHADSEAGSHAPSMLNTSEPNEPPSGELTLWPQGSNVRENIASPVGVALGRGGGVGAMSRESSAAFSAVIVSKPPLPTASESHSGLLSKDSAHREVGGLSASAALAARADLDMHRSFSRSGALQPTGDMTLGGESYASSALSGVLTLPPAHDQRTVHGAAQQARASDPHASTSQSQLSNTTGHSSLLPSQTSDGGPHNHGESTVQSEEFNLRSMGSHVVLAAAGTSEHGPSRSTTSGVNSRSGSGQYVAKSFSAPLDPEHPAKSSLHVPPGRHQRSAVGTRSGDVADVALSPLSENDAHRAAAALSAPSSAQRLSGSKVGSVAITSGFTRSVHTGGATPDHSRGLRSASPAATPKLAKQASGTV